MARKNSRGSIKSMAKRAAKKSLKRKKR